MRWQHQFSECPRCGWTCVEEMRRERNGIERWRWHLRQMKLLKESSKTVGELLAPGRPFPFPTLLEWYGWWTYRSSHLNGTHRALMELANARSPKVAS